MANVDWDDLAKSIEREEAVLVLGPDAIPFYSNSAVDVDGKLPPPEHPTFSNLTRWAIRNNSRCKLEYYFERDNFFQFSDILSKSEATKVVRDLAESRNWLPDNELLRQIVAMPFSLVLSLNPDKRIFDAFAQYWKAPQFDFFTAKDITENPNIAKLSKDNPLLYLMCGSVLDKRDSVILDYHDLFDLLKNLLMDNGISEKVTQTLESADRYVLLGFELDRWYFQLFIHYINRLGNNPFGKAALNFSFDSRIKEEIQEFVVKQFKVEYIAPNRNEFEALYNACAKRGILRKLQDPGSEHEVAVRALIANNKFVEAIAVLAKELSEQERAIDIPALESRYNDLVDREKKGVLTPAEFQAELNRIRFAILTYAHELVTA